MYYYPIRILQDVTFVEVQDGENVRNVAEMVSMTILVPIVVVLHQTDGTRIGKPDINLLQSAKHLLFILRLGLAPSDGVSPFGYLIKRG